MQTMFPTSVPATADWRRRVRHRYVGLVAVLVVLCSLNVTRIDRTTVDSDESPRPFLDLRDIAARAELIGDSGT